MPRHKHADVIHAWAEGEEIQSLTGNQWVDCPYPRFNNEHQYRIKPKIVKREGWVNIYKCGQPWAAGTSPVHSTKEDADTYATIDFRIACIRIEWEEEE